MKPVTMRASVRQEPEGWLSALQKVVEGAVEVIDRPACVLDRRVYFNVERRSARGTDDALLTLSPSSDLFDWLAALGTVEAQKFIAQFRHVLSPIGQDPKSAEGQGLHEPSGRTTA